MHQKKTPSLVTYVIHGSFGIWISDFTIPINKDSINYKPLIRPNQSSLFLTAQNIIRHWRCITRYRIFEQFEQNNEKGYIYIWCFQKSWYPQIIHSNRVFHYKPSILGYPYFWKHPYRFNAFIYIGGGINSFETYSCENGTLPPNRGETKTKWNLKPPPSSLRPLNWRVEWSSTNQWSVLFYDSRIISAYLATGLSAHQNYRLISKDISPTQALLVGGWTNLFEKYDRQIGSFPQGSGWK